MTTITERTIKGIRYFRVRFTKEDGKPDEKTFKTKAEANHFIKHDLANAEASPSNTNAIRWPDFAQRFLDDSKIGRSGKAPLGPKTLYDYAQNLDRTINPFFGEKQVRKITDADMERFQSELLTSDMSRRTAQLYFNLTKTILKYARAKKIISRVPGEDLTVTLDKRQGKKKIEIYSLEDMATLIETAKALRAGGGTVGVAWTRYFPLLLILAKTGVRISEALGLKWADFGNDWSTADVSRRTTVPFDGMEPGDRIGCPKSEHGNRTVAIPSDIVAYLEDHRNNCASEWLFATREGHPIQYSQVRNKMWLPLIERAGVPSKGIHSLRHFYASQLLAADVSMFELSRMLGHHSVAFTQDTYGHLTPEFAARRDAIGAHMAQLIPA